MLGAGGIFGKKFPQAIDFLSSCCWPSLVWILGGGGARGRGGIKYELTKSAAVIFSAYFGRYPVMFYFLLVATATAAWCAAATGYNSFMAARVLNGFFSTVTQGGGMMFIQDMFFFHERARKVNIWA